MLPGSGAFFGRLLLTLGVLAALTACANKPDAAAVYWQERLAAIVASPDRSAADRTNDVRRKPEQMLAFIGVRQGWWRSISWPAAATPPNCWREPWIPAAGSMRRSRVPLPPGRTAPSTGARGQAGPFERENHANMSVARPFEDPAPAEVASRGVDLVTIMFNYHDLGAMGVDRERMNRAVFAALKPGASTSSPTIPAGPARASRSRAPCTGSRRRS